MIVNRVKAVKDRMLFFLESISGNLATSLSNDHEQLLRLSEMAARLDQLQQELSAYTKQCGPVRDPYSIPNEAQAYLLMNPEVALLRYIRSFLECRNVLDIGANTGDVSKHLLEAGYRVYAFEPNPKTYERLQKRFAHNKEFRCHDIAIGNVDSTQKLFLVAELHTNGMAVDKDLSVYASLVQHSLPENLRFEESVAVPVRRLSTIHRDELIPAEIAIVKVDTEGNDLAVIDGMGENTYAIVVTEFWDAKHFFSSGKFGLLHEAVQAMRERNYFWHIVFYRVFDGVASTEPRFYCNIPDSVEGSWGNCVFFKSFALFEQARQWCRANLPANECFR
jgi:FkbM family methyltransferase